MFISYQTPRIVIKNVVLDRHPPAQDRAALTPGRVGGKLELVIESALGVRQLRGQEPTIRWQATETQSYVYVCSLLLLEASSVLPRCSYRYGDKAIRRWSDDEG